MILALAGESPGAGIEASGIAYAGALPNSVRVGDRSKMTIVGLPKPGEKRIVLRPPSPKSPGRTTNPESRLRTAELDWFWTRHSPAAAAAGPGRWSAALESLRQRRGQGDAIVSARLMRDVIASHGPTIAAAAASSGISGALIAAVIAVESAGQGHAVSPKGAQGLMQLIPATARRFGVANSFDPAENIGGGAAYLRWLLDRFGDDILLALAGYNAGEGAVEKHGGVPPYRETRDYVVKVLDALVAGEGMCALVPSGPREPCAFVQASR